MTSHNGQQIIIIHISPNISRNKGNQAIKIKHLRKWFGKRLLHCNTDLFLRCQNNREVGHGYLRKQLTSTIRDA